MLHINYHIYTFTFSDGTIRLSVQDSVVKLKFENGTELSVTEKVLFCIKWYFCKKNTLGLWSNFSHTNYFVCINFIHFLQFKVDFERQIFWETFHGNFYILSELLPEICWEKIAEEILFAFCLMPGLGLEPWLYVLSANTLPTRLRRLQ